MTAPLSRVITRFAPSPTGYLHLGHAHSALFTWKAAQAANGTFLLRIEDLDPGRSRPDFEQAIMVDLTWLGLRWPKPVRRQSEELDRYAKALDSLQEMDLLYPCFCTRKAIQQEIAQAPSAPHGPDGPLYPGTCQSLSPATRRARQESGESYALRLDMTAAMEQAGPLSWMDLSKGKQDAQPQVFGDVVLARKDIAASYHLAVVLDDADQDVTLVTRGEDLFEATHVHRLLQALLSLPVPTWHHHNLITDDRGQRLAKRHDALSIRQLRDQGRSAAAVRRLAGFPDPIA
ncbi:MAG: tRNA glutamyl-Q(34) synthetase GluQRS [Pseudomonadota bacterium]